MESKAEFVMAARNYECEERERLDIGIDFPASDVCSNGKMLLRVITGPRTKSGVVGVNTVSARDLLQKDFMQLLELRNSSDESE